MSTNDPTGISERVVIRSLLPVLALVALANVVVAEDFYVDPSLPSDCLSSYDPSTRSCGTGDETAFASLPNAWSSMVPGDSLLLRGGSYDQLAPSISGTSGQPITITNYPGETPTIADLSSSVALWFEQVSHISISGLSISNVRGFGHIYDSHHIEISNCIFSGGGVGTTGSMKVVRSTSCRFSNNSFSHGDGDVMVLQDAADHNLIEGNHFSNGYHSLLSIRCSEHNVIRANTFDNPIQKAIEIYDCEGTSDAPYRLDSTARNLVEGNAFVATRADTDDHSYNGIQHGAQRTIVRRNVFSHCLGGGVSYQHYSDESLHVYRNRMYNNTFYSNACHGIIGDDPSDPARYYDHMVMFNLLYKNTDCSGGPAQIRIPDPAVVVLIGNALATDDPHFVDEAGGDLRLAPSSPHIDAAGFVTTTIGSGSGTLVPVVDAGYFYDGYGIAGEVGDLIQLEGQSQQVRIIAIDDEAQLLTVNPSLTWSGGQGVHLAYSGASPDIGAFETTELLFADGFETGDTDGWSAAVQ